MNQSRLVWVLRCFKFKRVSMSILSLRLWQMLRPLAVHPLCLRGTVIVLSLKVFKDIERYPVTTWVRACILVKPCRNAYLDWNMTQQDKHPRWSKRLLAILRGCHCDVRMCESQVHTVILIWFTVCRRSKRSERQVFDSPARAAELTFWHSGQFDKKYCNYMLIEVWIRLVQ